MRGCRCFEAILVNLSVAELMRRGALAYETGEGEVALEVLAEVATGVAQRAGDAIDDALDFVEQSNARIAAMEALARE